MVEFAHLHCHSKYSIQDGMPTLKDYVDAIYKYNQSSQKYRCIGYACTEHGVIYSLPKHYNACNNPDHKERKTKAIYGCEIYHCIDINNNESKERYHIILLAKDEDGLRNLYEIVSHAGMHLIKGRQKDFPVTDINYLSSHGKGIIALTACIGGLVPQLIINGKEDKAIEYIDKFNEIFDEVYLEVQPHEIPEQLLVNETLVKISQQYNKNKLVMTSDSHYIYKDELEYHNILKDISHQKRFDVDAHLRTAEEMEEYCNKYNIPLESISNTAIIAKQCNVDPKPANTRDLMPKFKCPDNYDEKSYLKKLAFKGLSNRIINNKIRDIRKYILQLEYELDVICNGGFAGYFLILWDWFKWCKENNILLGPGRGCFEPDMMVMLSNGYSKPIKEVKIGDYVINEDGYSNKVLNKFEYNVDEEMTEITTCGKKIRCTNDHKILTLRTEKCLNQKYKTRYCTNKCINQSCLYRKKQKLEWIEASKIRVGDMLAYPIPKFPEKKITKIDLSIYGSIDKINSTIVINKDFAEFIGMYLGNGWIKKDIPNHNYQLGNAFNKGDIDKISRYKELVHELFGSKVYIVEQYHKTRNVVQLLIYNKTITNLIEDLCSHYAKHKYIPDILITQDKECLKGLIIGMMATDGCYKDTDKITYSTINYGLASQLKMIFAYLGYYSSITERVHKKHNWNNEYKVMISGKQLEDLKKDFLPKIQIRNKSYTRNSFIKDENNFYFRVGNVTNYNYKGNVYDLCVENNHTYIINNAIVHNSGASSLVSYCLDITKVDPVKNGFIFERFLSPERVSPPDIDSDVQRDERSRAIRYLQERYGIDKVSQIITFGEYKLKNTIKAIMSKIGVPFLETNEITKSIPDIIDGKEVNYDLIEGIATDPENEKYASLTKSEKLQVSNIYDKLKKVFDKYPIVYQGVKHICGCIASIGCHAGGVIISPYPINEHGAVIIGNEGTVLPLLQFEMNDLEFFGFIKYDILGLKTLDVIKQAMELAHLDYSWYESEDYTDDGVYDMLRDGETTDIFQFSSYTPTKMLKDFDAKNIDDLCAINAGNRPGPLEKNKETNKSMVDIYIERQKTGKIESIDSRIDDILAPTNGCLWYQEQCQNLGKVMAGYSMGNADTRIRSVLGKKKVDKIPEIRNEFIYGKKSEFDENHKVIGMLDEPSEYCEGALARGYSLEVCNKIFDTMEAFAKYSFNKSHSFCYAVIAYKCAWLSYHYPIEFAIANCKINENDKEAITATLLQARKRKIQVIQPDINNSLNSFTIDNGLIRYGLSGIKNVGSTSISFLKKYKEKTKGIFLDFDDYYNQIHDNSNSVIKELMDELRTSTGKNTANPMRSQVEVSLILSGCFDFSEPNRYKLLNHYADLRKLDKIKIMGEDISMPLDINKYTTKEKLKLEKYYMGGYISEHPLDDYPYADFETAKENEEVKTSGIISKISLKTTKTNKEYISLRVTSKDDIERTVNIFNQIQVKELKDKLKKGQLIILVGRVSKRYNNINAVSIEIVKQAK